MSTRLPQVSFVFNRHKTASLIRKGSVEIRISHNYRQKYISTGILLFSNQWKNNAVINSKDSVIINQMLDKLISEVRQIIFEMIQTNCIDISIVSDKLKELHGERISFIGFCKQRAEVRKYGKTADSKKRYNRFIRLFIAWGKIKDFDDIKESLIIEYDEYLTSKGMKPYSKWNNYHRFLNSFIIDAIDAGYIRKNPYKWVNISKRNSIATTKKHLTPEEFKKIVKTKLQSEKLIRVKDLFIFQTYTCLSYIDLMSFDSNMIQNVSGMPVYTGARHKTGTCFTIPLLPPAMKILHKYNGNLPVISNQKYNDYLKLLAAASGIDKALSSHWARHTGATLLLNEGVDMKIVSKICGHSSTRITEQVYAKILDETVVAAVKTLEKKTSRTSQPRRKV